LCVIEKNITKEIKKISANKNLNNQQQLSKDKSVFTYSQRFAAH